MRDKKEHVPIEETDFFKRYVSVANDVWSLAMSWRPFPQDTVGRQMCKALDSVGANLVEGDGRYGDADSLHYFTIARGSAREGRYWLSRALDRKLISQGDFDRLYNELDHATRALNNLITYRRNRKAASQVREERAEYGDVPEHRTPNTEHFDSYAKEGANES